MPKIGLGAGVSVNDGEAGAQVDIEDVLNLTVPDDEIDVIERKPLKNANRKKKKIPGLTEPGQFQFQYEFSKTKKARLDALKGVEGKEWVVTVPSDEDADEVQESTVSGFVVSNKMDQVEADQVQTVTCIVQVDGEDVE